MSAALSPRNALRITMVAPSAHASLAAGLLVSHLGLSAARAAQLLNAAPSVLAESLPARAAQRLASLLLALGVPVRLDPATGGPSAGPVELSVQAIGPVEPAAERLAGHLGQSADALAAALAGPGGLVLALPCDVAEPLRRTLRREAGLRVTLSIPETATYDLFGQILGQPGHQGLLSLLQRLGLRPCGFSGALASGLDHRMARHVLARFPHAGIVALNRDFQRFDLFLTGVGGVGLQDLADFLATRGQPSLARLKSLSAANPLRVETGLIRAAARQFQADYAAIGLETRLRLSLPQPALA
jgi:hypothetical protein